MTFEYSSTSVVVSQKNDELLLLLLLLLVQCSINQGQLRKQIFQKKKSEV